MLLSNPLRRRLDELERAVEGIKEAGAGGEERRAYWEHFYSPEQVEVRDRERRQGDRNLLEKTGPPWGSPRSPRTRCGATSSKGPPGKDSAPPRSAVGCPHGRRNAGRNPDATT